MVTATESDWLIKIDDKIEQRYPVRHIYALNQTTTRISEIIEFVLTEKSQKTTIRYIEASSIEEASFNVEVLSDMIYQKLLEE